MAQNITIAGASYSDVPAIQVPKTGSGTATFVDTSDADAVAADLALNKTAYVNGVKIVGTSEGGGTSYMETLWTNASVSSNFSAQDVLLSDGANNYDYLLIDYIFSTSAQDHSTLLVPVSDLAVAGREYSLRINAASYNRTGARNFRFTYHDGTIINYGQIYFAGASYNTSSNNGYVLPYKIVGIKLSIPSANGVSF